MPLQANSEAEARKIVAPTGNELDIETETVPPSAPPAHILPTIGDVPATMWRIERSRKVMEKDRRRSCPLVAARTCAANSSRCPAGVAVRLARSQHRPIG